MTITSRTKRAGLLATYALAAVVGPLAAAPAEAQTVSRSPVEGNALILRQGTENMSSARSASMCDAIVSQ